MGVLFTIFLIGCAAMEKVKVPGIQAPGTPAAGPLAKIVVYRGDIPLGESGPSADGAEINIGGSIMFTAQGRDASGNPIAINPTWTTNKPEVIEINPSVGSKVTVKGLKEGSPEIYIEFQGVKRKLEYIWVR